MENQNGQAGLTADATDRNIQASVKKEGFWHSWTKDFPKNWALLWLWRAIFGATAGGIIAFLVGVKFGTTEHIPGVMVICACAWTVMMSGVDALEMANERNGGNS